MSLRYQAMKKIKVVLALSLVMLLCGTSMAQSAWLAERINIPNGDSVVVTPQYPSPRFSATETAIAEKYADEILSSALLRAMSVQDYEEDIRAAMRENCYGLYTDVRIRKSYCCFENIKGVNYVRNKFSDYLLKMVRIKKVREYLFSVGSRVLSEFVTYYPKDFKQTLITSLEDIQQFMEAMPHHSYKVMEGRYTRYDLYVDGKLNEEIPGTINGFILRRILIDEVPADEIKGYVTSLIKTLKGVKNGRNPDILCKVTINNEIIYCLTSSGAYFQPKKGGDQVTPSKHPCMWGDFAQCVTAIHDKKINYYRIRNGVYDKKGQWSPYTDDYDLKELLIDSNCELIYEK